MKKRLARTLVCWYHRNQAYDQREDSYKPYTYHLYLVASPFNGQAAILKRCYIIALLHDILEDTTCPPWLIRFLFGKRIYDVVIELTHRKGEEKYFDYIERIRSIAGITVKVSDVAVNLEHAKLNPNYAGLIPRYKKTLDTLLERIKD